jgi:phage portal protein BeeE
MSFWSNASRWVRKSNTPDWGVLERYLAWAFGGGASASGIIVNPQTAMQAATVYSCIKVLAEAVGMLPCNVYRKTARRASRRPRTTRCGRSCTTSRTSTRARSSSSRCW